jgi:hypothetical protein
MKQVILDHHLDILVYGEIGMDLSTYLLAFSRLAPISLVFWGHAITSGVLDYAAISSIPPGPSSNSSGSRLISRASRGGPDYFISSVLFENHLIPPLQQQQRYSERLILQEGLTTYFEHPEQPFPVSTSAESVEGRLGYIASFLSATSLDLPRDETPWSYVEMVIKKNLPDPKMIHLYGVPQVKTLSSPLP